VSKKEKKGVKPVHAGAKVLMPKYEPGRPIEADDWLKKLTTTDEITRYLKTAERYFCEDLDKWYGSEKRKTPA